MLHSSDRRCSPGPRRSLMRTRPALWELALKRERLPRMPSAQSARPHGCCFGGVRRFVDDSHRPLDTNATEHALRCVVLGKITTARAPSTALRSPRGSTAWWKPSSPASNRIATSHCCSPCHPRRASSRCCLSLPRDRPSPVAKTCRARTCSEVGNWTTLDGASHPDGSDRAMLCELVNESGSRPPNAWR